ncbi:hypothetical protein SAMN05216559_3246 [Halomicrobium zhouii]|uniref:Uncharacterized protein n=2 Tax=Halomicrobium zhouii TaxID=767519 RepID=A0A1I6LWC2_9EURY|nr:hypothetical protein SAMN05216559_3246 [Halomicrobium zhouii]
MACVRCGGSMAEFELGENVSRRCEECGFVDVPVSHVREESPRESWEDAIDRFNARQYGVKRDVTTHRPGTADD